MLRFFRKLRKTAIFQGDTLKTIYYFLGEIALIVLGILIAFKINDWNEKRYTKKKMKDIYITLSKELETDLNRANFIDSVYETRDSICLDLIRNGIDRSDVVERPQFYLGLPLRSHTLMISRYGYDLLMQNVNSLPHQSDTLIPRLNKIFINARMFNEKYDAGLDAFTWRLIDKWSATKPWYSAVRAGKIDETPPAAIEYFSEDQDYLNTLAAYREYVYNAEIPVNTIIEEAPECLAILERLINQE